MYILELYQNNYSKDLVALDSLFDHAIEDNIPCQSGAGLIYRHYFIWFGLNICTIDLDYANDAMGIARVIMMFLGLFLFYLGVFNNAHLNKKSHKLDKKLMIPFEKANNELDMAF